MATARAGSGGAGGAVKKPCSHYHPALKRRRAIFNLIWDKLGIAMSGLCLLDCLFLPLLSALLFSFAPSVGWIANLHAFLLPLVGLTAAIAFYHSFRAHRAYSIVLMGLAGFTLLALGEIFESQLRFFLFNWVSLLGSALLIGAHLKNLLMHTGHRHVHAVIQAQSAHVP